MAALVLPSARSVVCVERMAYAEDTAGKNTRGKSLYMALCSIVPRGFIALSLQQCCLLPALRPSYLCRFRQQLISCPSRTLCSHSSDRRNMAESNTTSDLVATLRDIEQRIEAARQPDQPPVTLVAVSKTKPASMLQALYDAGHRHFGENYVSHRACSPSISR